MICVVQSITESPVIYMNTYHWVFLVYLQTIFLTANVIIEYCDWLNKTDNFGDENKENLNIYTNYLYTKVQRGGTSIRSVAAKSGSHMCASGAKGPGPIAE